MDRIERLSRSLRRAANSQLGDRTFADLLLDHNRELLLTESRSKSKKDDKGLRVFGRAVLALKDFEQAAPKFTPPAHAGVAADTDDMFAIVPVRMRAPAQVAAARAVAAAGGPDTPPPTTWFKT